jgi:flagella basal body P-ring formation protein FlgA
MKTLLTAIVCAAIAGPAFAGQPVTLKAKIVDADGVVTLGDLFDGAGAAGRMAVANRTGTTLMLDAATVQGLARRAGLDWPNAEGYRRIAVQAGAAGGGGGAPPAVSVAPRGNVDVLTWSRNLAAGEIVQPQDLVWGKAALAPSDAPNDPDAVVGLSARRALRAGAPVGGRDVASPVVIKTGEIITLTFRDGGLMLQLQAKALSGGGMGDTINVQNTSSKKIVQAVVEGPGQAVVGPAAEQLKLNRSTRYALR